MCNECRMIARQRWPVPSRRLPAKGWMHAGHARNPYDRTRRAPKGEPLNATELLPTSPASSGGVSRERHGLKRDRPFITADRLGCGPPTPLDLGRASRSLWSRHRDARAVPGPSGCRSRLPVDASQSCAAYAEIGIRQSIFWPAARRAIARIETDDDPPRRWAKEALD